MVEEYKHIKQIFIANVLESFYKSYDSMASETKIYWNLYDKLDGNRALLYNDDNKVVITSVKINEQHFQDTLNLMGWRNVFNFSPDSSTQSISYDIINNPLLHAKLISIIKQNPGISIIPYKATEEFYELVQYLKKKGLEFSTPETMDHEFDFIHDYANTKRGFRHLWAHAIPRDIEAKINTPLGFITEGKSEAIEAGWWFMKKMKSFVVKYSKGTQGIGILMLKKEELPTEKKKFIEEMNRQMDEKIWEEAVIIVEELIDVDKEVLGGSPSIEFFINAQGKVKPTYSCEQLLAPDGKTFTGIYMHPELLKNKYIKTANEAGVYFGKELSDLDYRGNYDIDLVISKTGKLYAVESNLRRTGGTHIQHAGLSLLGEDFIYKYHVAGEDIKLENEVTYEECKERLADLYFTKDKDQGFFYVNPDMLAVDILNIIIVAHSKDELLGIRDEIIKKIKRPKLHLKM